MLISHTQYRRYLQGRFDIISQYHQSRVENRDSSVKKNFFASLGFVRLALGMVGSPMARNATKKGVDWFFCYFIISVHQPGCCEVANKD
jgi:hypothetical protein